MTTQQERDELERERAWDETHPRPDRSDEDLLHAIVKLAQTEFDNPRISQRQALQAIEGLARSLLLRLPEPPAARPLQMSERIETRENAQYWAEERERLTAGDAALRAFAPTSRDEQAQVDRYEATR